LTLCLSNRSQIKEDIKERNIRPKLVGFLANEDPAAMKYAEWTSKTCAETGVEFELRKVTKLELEEKITEANEDKTVNGIMVYYPVFGGKQVKYKIVRREEPTTEMITLGFISSKLR
jgi:methylenetetrahydrofolate dehydrogenase (NAD+)